MKKCNLIFYIFLCFVYIHSQNVEYFNKGIDEFKNLSLEPKKFHYKQFNFPPWNSYYEINGLYTVNDKKLKLKPKTLLSFKGENLLQYNPYNLTLDTISILLKNEIPIYNGQFELEKLSKKLVIKYRIINYFDNQILIEDTKQSFILLANNYNIFGSKSNKKFDVVFKSLMHKKPIENFVNIDIFKQNIPKKYRNWFLKEPIKVQIVKIKETKKRNPDYKLCNKTNNLDCEKFIKIEKVTFKSENKNELFKEMSLFWVNENEECKQSYLIVKKVNGKFGMSETKSNCNDLNNPLQSQIKKYYSQQ